MASKSVLLVAIVVLLALGGGVAAWFFLGGTAAPKIVAFIGQARLVTQDGAALAAPRDDAELVARLAKGMSVDVTGILEGGKWAAITLPDKRVAYFPVGSLGVSQVIAEQPGPGGTAGLDPGPIVELEPTSDVYTTSKPEPVYLEPNIHAPQKYQIDTGTSVPVIQRSKDHVWVMASTEDGDPAFLLAADLGPPQPGKAIVEPIGASVDGLPDTVDGVAKVKTTSIVEVDGQELTLAGISGEGGAYADQIQTLIDSEGGNLHCVRQTKNYQCITAEKIDIALSALYMGGARPTDDAPDSYQNQARSAKFAHRGVWQQ